MYCKDSVVEHWPSMFEVLGSALSTGKEKEGMMSCACSSPSPERLVASCLLINT